MKKIFFILFVSLSTIVGAQVPVTTSLTLHLDAAVGFSGSPVTWTDQSGNSHNATTIIGSDPTAVTSNGFNAVRFNGTQAMGTASNSIVTGKEGTIFVVLSYQTATGHAPVAVAYDQYLDNEMTFEDNVAYHNSQANYYKGQPFQCSSAIPNGLVTVESASYGETPTDVNYYVNGIKANSPQTQYSTNVATSYTTANRYAFIGSRIQSGGALYHPYSSDIYEVLVYNRKLTSTEMDEVNEYLTCKYSASHLVCDSDSTCIDRGCTDQCYWRVTGNVIYNNRNIFGTISNDPIRFQTDGAEHMRLTESGELGLGSTSPTARLHVDLTGLTATTGIRFQSLATSSNTDFLVVDGSGNVTKRSITSFGPTLSCSTTNYVPKVTGANTLDCSTIYDNGTSVGISTTGSFSYSTNPQLQGSTTAPSSGTVILDVNGVTRSLAFLATSDATLKTNIQDIESPLEKVLKLSGKTYYWNDEAQKELGGDGGRQIGFLAQDVAKVVPEAVAVGDNGHYAMNYNAIIPLLTEAVKDLNTKYEAVKQENDELKSLLDDICTNGCYERGANLSGIEQNNNGDANKLFQNTPNPFSQSTEITYVFNTGNKGYIMVNSLDGKALKKVDISKGKGFITINANELAAGTYSYTMLVDGKVIDTKLMIISK